MQTFTLKTYHVNSKRILNEITTFVDEIILNFNIIWNSALQRDAILEVIDEHLQDMQEEKKIEQWNVICDGRNNKQANIENKITYLDIEFRQRNCYNITKLKYVIKGE